MTVKEKIEEIRRRLREDAEKEKLAKMRSLEVEDRLEAAYYRGRVRAFVESIRLLEED